MITLRRCKPLLGTFVEISAYGPVAQVQPALDAAFAAVAKVHRLMSFQEASSDLSRINRSGVGAQLTVHPWTTDVLTTAVQMYHASDGLFDCAMVGDSAAALRILAPGVVQLVEPATLDLSGIAKGFAVDQAIEIIQSRGIGEAIVNAGGDLRVIGTRFGRIHLRPCAARPTALAIQVSNRAVATSGHGGGRGAGVKAFVFAHQRQNDLEAVTVLAGCAMVADALTKPIWRLAEQASALLAHWGAEAILHHADGRTTVIDDETVACA